MGGGTVEVEPEPRAALGKVTGAGADRLELWRVWDRCALSDVSELLRLARTLDAWTDELLAYWTPIGRRGVRNGATEATNALIKRVKKIWTVPASVETGFDCRPIRRE